MSYQGVPYAITRRPSALSDSLNVIDMNQVFWRKRNLFHSQSQFGNFAAAVRRERDGEALLGDGDALAPGDLRDDQRLAHLQRVGQADPLPLEDALRTHLHAQRGCVRRERKT